MSRLNSNTQVALTLNGAYTIITKEKEIENDKERLIKIFNFNRDKVAKSYQNEIHLKSSDHNNKASLSNQNLNLHLNQHIPNTRNKASLSNQNQNLNQHIPNTRNKNGKMTEGQSLSMNTKNHTNLIASKDITRKTNQSSHFNTVLSDDTEKETKSRLMLIKDKIIVDNIYENESFNGDDDNYNNDNDNDGIDDIDGNLNNSEKNNSRRNSNNLQSGIKYLPVSNSSSDYSGNSSKRENAETNVLIRRYDQANIKFADINQSKAQKIRQLFYAHPSYDISNRMLNDEITAFHNNRDDNKQFRFIKDVQQDNAKLHKIKLTSLLKLSDCAVYNLLSFCYENFYNLTSINNQLVASKIHLSLNRIFQNVIEAFKAKYRHIIQLEAFYFKQKTLKHSKMLYPILDLVLKAKVITKEVNKSYEIGYSFISEKESYNQKWKFDTKPKRANKIWLASEYEVYHLNINRFCYAQPVPFFCVNDGIELRMNLFSKKTILNPFSIDWEEIVVAESPRGFYEKSILKCPFPFDRFYACEVENMIHLWSEIRYDSAMLNNFRRLYSKHFSIGRIVYDVSKILFYKIQLVARLEGRVKRNQYINFDIEIVSKHKALKNEIQTIGLLNSTLLSDCIQIRNGTPIIFYLTEMLPNMSQ